MRLFRRKKKAENDRGSLPTSEVKQSSWNMIEINRKINDIVDEYDGKYDQLSELYEKRHELENEFAAVSDAHDSINDDITVDMLNCLTPSTYESNFNKRKIAFEIYDKKYLKFCNSLNAIDMKILVELELILNKKFCRKCCILHSDICEKMKKKETSAFCQGCGAELKPTAKFCGKCGTPRS